MFGTPDIAEQVRGASGAVRPVPSFQRQSVRRSVSAGVCDGSVPHPAAAGVPVPSQGKILTAVADLLDAGTLQPTGARSLGAITAANVMEGHALLEDGHVVGKLVLSGWE